MVLLYINAENLPLLEAFPYLGQAIAYNNTDWVALYLNLHKYWRRWGMITRVIEQTGATVWSQEAIYMTVVQSVLLYDSESWLVTGEMIEVLMGFHHWEAQQITGMIEKCGEGG